MIFLLVLELSLLAGYAFAYVYFFSGKRRFKFIYLACCMIILSLLGGLLIYQALKLNTIGIYKTLLIMAGSAPAIMIIGTILHNILSAMLYLLTKRKVEEPIFFIIAVIISPASFLIGIVGGIMLTIKNII